METATLPVDTQITIPEEAVTSIQYEWFLNSKELMPEYVHIKVYYCNGKTAGYTFSKTEFETLLIQDNTDRAGFKAAFESLLFDKIRQKPLNI